MLWFRPREFSKITPVTGIVLTRLMEQLEAEVVLAIRQNWIFQ